MRMALTSYSIHRKFFPPKLDKNEVKCRENSVLSKISFISQEWLTQYN